MVSAIFTPSFIIFICSIVASIKVASGEFVEGDTCGVDPQKFATYDFTGNYTVAGDGCSLENNTKSGCFCSILYDGNPLSEFIWQCGNNVTFGPKTGKECPATVPVIKAIGVDSINFKEEQLGITVPCNTTIHPTGKNGDDVCGYSECEDGGDYSAICGCVDFGERNDTESSGMQWICLHSTCGCGEQINKTDSGEDTSSALNIGHPFTFLLGAVVPLSVLMFTMW